MASSSLTDGLQQTNNTTTTNKIELIWQMGLTNLNDTDNEIRLPFSVSDKLNHQEIILLESHLSEYLDAPVVSFKDLTMNVYRFIRMPEMQKSASSPDMSMSPAMSCASLMSSPSVNDKAIDPKPRQHGKKSKIPRPPNAFILYRQKQHPILKAANPELHNNDISIILGQKWKSETQDTRDKFKALAEELKRQHHIKFPDYQYAPRKASEKKRRMTARKLAKLQQDGAIHDDAEFPTPNNSGFEDFNAESPLSTDAASMQVDFNQIPSLEDILGLNNHETQLFTSTNASQEIMDEYVNNLPLQPMSTTMMAMPNNTFVAVNTPPPDHNAFLNSLVDWNSLLDGIDYIDATFSNAPAHEADQAAHDGSQLPVITENEYAAFRAELERTSDYLE